MAYRIQRMPKLVPHVSIAGNFIDGVFQVHAPVQAGLDRTRLWTRGGTFSTSAGVIGFAWRLYLSRTQVRRFRRNPLAHLQEPNWSPRLRVSVPLARSTPAASHPSAPHTACPGVYTPGVRSAHIGRST